MPTKAEKAWMDAVKAYGCIVCRNLGFGFVPCAVHHLLSGGRRIGHMHTIGLCDPGHHQYAPLGSGQISRHPHKAKFEAAYGTEVSLWEQTRLVLGYAGRMINNAQDRSMA